MGPITFKINGKPHSVGSEVSSDVTLLDYVRNSAGLKGTKYMCREGGCGACILSAKKNSSGPFSVNSCLIPITSCHGWEITTIEEVGNRKKGYHKLQTELAEGHGSQCGYCSPSWIMSMYSLLHSNPDITMLEVEKSIASNTCRCTGYRPILETFKKFAKDAPRQITLPDIEDLRICRKTNEVCDKSSCEDSEWCLVQEDDVKDPIEFKLKDDRLWARAETVKDVFKILNREGIDSYMLVNGNTAKGVYPIDEYPRVLIDISAIKELKGYTMDQNLIINAGTTLTEFLEILKTVSKEDNFHYLEKFYDHVFKVAHIPVRNVGTIAGNLMIKNQHKAFPSDIFLLLELVGAQVTIQTTLLPKRTLTMQQFLNFDMTGYVMWNVMLPPLNNDHHVVTYKIMQRSLNAHALVNAGFLYELNSENVVQSTRIAYGALSPSFVRASATEKFLVGKKLFTNETLTSALKILEQELVIDEDPLEPSIEYRRNVALGLFYKALLKLSPETNINVRYRSGATDLHDTRPVSKSFQSFETDHSKWPLTQPIAKVEALILCAGEATYTEDLPILPDEVFCAFALSTIAVGDIVSIDGSKALAYPGVIAFYTAKDIPGKNSYIPSDANNVFVLDEEVLCSGSVKYFNQPIGIVVAETRHIADVAAKLVTATYTNVKDPITDIKDAINDLDRTTQVLDIPATDPGNDVTKVIEGSNTIYSQYHYTMETLVTVARPSDEGLEVYCTAQWMEGVQLMIAQALDIEQNKVDVHTRRLGGAFGVKIVRNIQGAVATALVVNKLSRPCRFIQSLTTNMKAVGKRFPCFANYEVGVNSSGVIQYINTQYYADNGYIASELVPISGQGVYFNTYYKSKWHYTIYNSLTDTASNTSTRAPGSLDHIAMAELVIERIAYEMKLDPLDVRLANIDEEYKSDMKEIFDNLMIKSDYTKRREAVNKFNTENRWKKRGLRFAFMRWMPAAGINLYINLSVFRGDASVIITHGGIEMGQGVNTKAVQAAAYMLNIPTDKIVIKSNNTTIAPNCLYSAASATSQNACIGVKRACQELLDRLKPIRDQMDNPTWEELITEAYNMNVDLQTHGFTRTDEDILFPVYGAALTEVELDVLTGEFEILRADIYTDVGESINPEVDIGQVEGAFIMGLGYWTCENLIYSKTGEVLTDRTWNYKVPLAGDIPQDMRVYFRKNSYSADKIFGSKTVSEAPACVSISVAFALREAIVAARLDAGIPTTEWYPEDGPYTVERNHLLTSTNIEHFKLNNN